MKNNRTIRELSKLNGRVYVYLANVEVGEKFLQQAEDEGFTFADGAKPTERCYAEIMAVNNDTTINFVGTNGRIAFGSGIKKIGDDELIRIDFEKYFDGVSDYFYRKDNQMDITTATDGLVSAMKAFDIEAEM